MTESSSCLGDRLRDLVGAEAPSAALRSAIEEQLRRPLPARNPGPRVLALAASAAVIVAAVFLAAGAGPVDPGQRASAVTPAVPGDVSAPDLPHGRSSTRVLASNATRTPAIAPATLQRLKEAGYVTVGSMEAPELSTTSRVYFAPGYEAEARDVARLLGLDDSAVNRTPPPVPEPNGAEVLVVLGADAL